METESEKKISRGLVGSRRDFLSKSSALLAGAGVASFGIPGIIPKGNGKDYTEGENDSFEIFDCHLHSPSDKGEIGNGIR